MKIFICKVASSLLVLIVMGIVALIYNPDEDAFTISDCNVAIELVIDGGTVEWPVIKEPNIIIADTTGNVLLMDTDLLMDIEGTFEIDLEEIIFSDTAIQIDLSDVNNTEQALKRLDNQFSAKVDIEVIIGDTTKTASFEELFEWMGFEAKTKIENRQYTFYDAKQIDLCFTDIENSGFDGLKEEEEPGFYTEAEKDGK